MRIAVGVMVATLLSYVIFFWAPHWVQTLVGSFCLGWVTYDVVKFV